MLGDNVAVYIITSQCNDAKFQMEKKVAMQQKSTMISSYT